MSGDMVAEAISRSLKPPTRLFTPASEIREECICRSRSGRWQWRGLAACALGATGALAQSSERDPSPPDPQVRTTTPIRHVVIIFDENISFDHYFGTYPYAANPPGEPQFHAAPGTPTVNGLTEALLPTRRTRSGWIARRR